MDNLSPFERVKMRRVHHKIKNVVDKRRKRVLYADFLRTDVDTILPAESSGDGDFFRLPKSPRIVVHEEARSILIIVDTHWTVSDAVKMMAAIRYYGVSAHTVTVSLTKHLLRTISYCKYFSWMPHLLNSVLLLNQPMTFPSGLPSNQQVELLIQCVSPLNLQAGFLMNSV